MGIVLKNNAKSTLSSGISSLDTNIPVTDTSSFPSVSGGDYFYATIESTSGTYEIVKVTQVNASSFDVTRAQENTIAVPFNSGSRIELRITVQSLEDHFDSTLTAAQILDELLTVDGAGSGLNADLLDGIDSTAFALLSGAAFTGNVSTTGTFDVTSGTATIGKHALSGDASLTFQYHDDGVGTGTIFWNRGAVNRWYLRSSESALFIRNVNTGGNAVSFSYSTNNASFSGSLLPVVSDGSALGDASTMWSDLFLASGAVINFNNGDVTLTHSSNALTGSGGQLLWTYDGASTTPPARFTNTTDNANNTALVVESDRATPTAYDTAWIDWRVSNNAGTQTTIAKFGAAASDITAGSEDGVFYWRVLVNAVMTDKMYLTTSGLAPYTNDGLSLGFGAGSWADLFLASGGVINWNNGDVLLTHSSDLLTMTGGRFAVSQNISAGTPSGQFYNSTDAAAVMAIRLEGDRATPTTGDSVYASWYLSDSAGNQDEAMRIACSMWDITSTSEDSRLEIALLTAGTLTTRYEFYATVFRPNVSDGVALGDTSKQWADLFLATGGVINFNNGDVTITHSTNALTFAGAANGYVFNQHILGASHITAHYATAIPVGGTTGAGLRVSSTANFGVFFGSGAPSLSAAKGSLYLRSDGSGTNDRMYVNTDGATTWTAVVTVA